VMMLCLATACLAMASLIWSLSNGQLSLAHLALAAALAGEGAGAGVVLWAGASMLLRSAGVLGRVRYALTVASPLLAMAIALDGIMILALDEAGWLAAPGRWIVLLPVAAAAAAGFLARNAFFSWRELARVFPGHTASAQ
jgi:hypothetical protein